MCICSHLRDPNDALLKSQFSRHNGLNRFYGIRVEYWFWYFCELRTARTYRTCGWQQIPFWSIISVIMIIHVAIVFCYPIWVICIFLQINILKIWVFGNWYNFNIILQFLKSNGDLTQESWMICFHWKWTSFGKKRIRMPQCGREQAKKKRLISHNAYSFQQKKNDLTLWENVNKKNNAALSLRSYSS